MNCEWIRNCPTCNKLVSYVRKFRYEKAKSENRSCLKCTINSLEYKQKRSKTIKGRPISKLHKENIGKSMKGRKITWSDKISKKLKGRIIPPHQEIKRLESRLKMNYDEYCNRRPKFFNYKSRVMSITRRQPIQTLKNYEKVRGLAGTIGGYQLDHIITIKNGFEHGVNPHIIGNVKNLNFIPWEDNLQKNKNSKIDISKSLTTNCLNETEIELLKTYSKFDVRLYQCMKAVTEAWYENPAISKEQALEIAKQVAKV